MSPPKRSIIANASIAIVAWSACSTMGWGSSFDSLIRAAKDSASGFQLTPNFSKVFNTRWFGLVTSSGLSPELLVDMRGSCGASACSTLPGSWSSCGVSSINRSFLDGIIPMESHCTALWLPVYSPYTWFSHITSLEIITNLVSMFKKRWVSAAWSFALPRYIAGIPRSSSLPLIFFVVLMIPISPNCLICSGLGISFLKNSLCDGSSWFLDRSRFSMSVTVIAASPHKEFFSFSGSFAARNVALIRPNRVANFRSIFPLNWGESRAVNSNSMFVRSLLSSHLFFKSLFSPALSHRMYFTGVPLSFIFRRNDIISFAVSFFRFSNLVHTMSVASSTIPNQYFDPPIVFSLMEEISMKILSPGVVLFFSVTFGTSLCLAFAILQSSQGFIFPVIFHSYDFAVFRNTSSEAWLKTWWSRLISQCFVFGFDSSFFSSSAGIAISFLLLLLLGSNSIPQSFPPFVRRMRSNTNTTSSFVRVIIGPLFPIVKPWSIDLIRLNRFVSRSGTNLQSPRTMSFVVPSTFAAVKRTLPFFNAATSFPLPTRIFSSMSIVSNIPSSVLIMCVEAPVSASHVDGVKVLKITSSTSTAI